MRLITYILISLVFGSLLAQNRQKEIQQLFQDYQYYNTKEFAYIKPDKKIYYSGESLDFDVVLLNQYFSISDLSQIVHIDLVHETEKENRKFIFRLESGMQKGKINLPQDIPSGNYQIVAYTHFMRNQDIEYHAHRVPVYIQNVLDNQPGKVASRINYEVASGTEVSIDNTINLKRTPNAISLEIMTPTKGDFYLVSEGLKSIQLIANLNPTGPVTKFALPRDQFKSGFQRFILLNGNLEIVSVRSFYLENSSPFVRKKQVEDRLELDVRNNLISKVVLNEDDGMDHDPLSLFKRLYRLYYNLPLELSIESLAFEELIADSTLLEFSKYSYAKWEDIIQAKKLDSEIIYYPEKNIRLSGRVEGDSSLVAKSNVAIHLFENQLDITKKLAADGTFSIELILPTGQDFFTASVLDNEAMDITEKVKVVFDEYEDFSYLPNPEFFYQNTTDSIIKANLEFKYILSTYSNSKAQKRFFWDDIEFDKTTKISDYYKGIENFEEFIKEAVMNVSVAEKQGEKILRIYNYSEGGFGKPQLIVLDNKVLNNTLPLFKIPLDSIEVIKTIFNEETLRKLGKNFVKGVIVVKTLNGSYQVNAAELDPGFKNFTGYTINNSANEVSDEFNTSEISDFTFQIRNVYEINKTAEKRFNALSIECFSKEGMYYYSNESLKRE